VSFRLRVTLLTAAAVAIAAIGASVAMYLVVQDQLMHQVQTNLEVAAQTVARGGPGPGDGRRGFGPRSQFMTGRHDMYAQIITASGNIFKTDFDQPNTALVAPEVKDVASGKRGAFFATADAQDTRLAVYVAPIQGGGAIEVAQDLGPIDAALAQTRILLIAFAAGAILLAAGLGALIGRAALAPVKRLTATVEEVTKTRDLSRRVALTPCSDSSRHRCAHNVSLSPTHRTSFGPRSPVSARTSNFSSAVSRPIRSSASSCSAI
jgi:two-component system sensor histidine kinase MprB